MCWVVSAGTSFQIVIHGQVQPTYLQRSFVGLRVHTVDWAGAKYPSASLSPALWMLSSCRKLVLDAVPYTIHPKSSLERTMVRYSISSVSLSPPHFKCATTRMRLRASLHWILSALMCSLKERCESHHRPRNFVDSSTGRSVPLILIVGGLWALYGGAVKCTTLHLWAANLNPFFVAHSCMAFTACCRCLSMVSSLLKFSMTWSFLHISQALSKWSKLFLFWLFLKFSNESYGLWKT